MADSQRRTVHLNLTFGPHGPVENIDETTFHNWVAVKCREFVVERLRALQTDLVLASQARAHFLTTLRSSHELAGLSLDEPTAPSSIANALLRIDLPF